MKTTLGRLAVYVGLLFAGLILLLPMRAGKEDRLILGVQSLALNPGERYIVGYAIESEENPTVAFSSDAPGVADVDASGMITAVSPGTAHITAKTSNGLSQRIAVSVSGVAVTSFALSSDALVLNKGDVSGLSCIYNEGASSRGVEWYSTNEAVAQVDNVGRVSAIGAGEAYIVAKAEEGFAGTAKVTVLVPATSVAIVPGTMTLGMGARIQLRLSLLPADSTDTPLSWTSSASNVISVGDSGIVHAISPGVATVTLRTQGGLANSVLITVESAAKDFQLTPTSVTLERGSTFTLDAELIGVESTAEHHIDWASSNPNVASVSDGVLNAVASGTTDITATADGFTAVCRVQVQTTVQEIWLDQTEVTLLREETGAPIQLTAAVSPADADDVTVKFISDNELVATVSQDGTVTPTGGYGTAHIIATAVGGAQASFTINVVTPAATPEPEAAQGAE